MKNVIFKALLCLIPLAFAACGDDSGSNADEPSEVSGNTTPGELIPGKCIIRNYRGYESVPCSSFTLNEADSTYSFEAYSPTGTCIGPDVEHLSWHDADTGILGKFKYSIHGDTLFARQLDYDVKSAREVAAVYCDADRSLGIPYESSFVEPLCQRELTDQDSLYAVNVYVSDSHQGIKGRWKYVTSYHESPHTYINPGMDNVITYMSIGEDAYLLEEVDNPEYSFARTLFVADLMEYISDSEFLGPSILSVPLAGYSVSPDNEEHGIKLVSESANRAVFNVKGKEIVISNISTDINYYFKASVKFDLEYAGQKCSFHDGYERISERTCKPELADSLRLHYEYDRSPEYDYESRPVISVEAEAYEYGSNEDEFDSCLSKLLM